VQFRGIQHADSGGDTPLGVARIAIVDAALGDQQDAAVLPGEKGAVESGNAAADYDIVVVFNRGLLSIIWMNRVVFELPPCVPCVWWCLIPL
jgi:hypothetical protein